MPFHAGSQLRSITEMVAIVPNEQYEASRDLNTAPYNKIYSAMGSGSGSLQLPLYKERHRLPQHTRCFYKNVI